MNAFFILLIYFNVWKSEVGRLNPFFLQIANQKINSLTKEELLSLAYQYNIYLNDSQAQKVIAILRSETIDIANKEQVDRILYRLQTEIDSYVASVIQQLLKQYAPLLKSFGYE